MKRRSAAATALSADRLRQVIEYAPDTGCFARLTGPRRGPIRGRCSSAGGYQLIEVDGSQFYAHRLAWLYVYGEWPTNVIDHIDGDKANNRIANLRDVTETRNNHNHHEVRSNNGHGYLGVTKHGPSWRARIRVRGCVIQLGSYPAPWIAEAVYRKAKAVFHDRPETIGTD